MSVAEEETIYQCQRTQKQLKSAERKFKRGRRRDGGWTIVARAIGFRKEPIKIASSADDDPSPTVLLSGAGETDDQYV